MSSSEIVLLRELEKDASMLEKHVRVTGFVTHMDLTHHMVQITHGTSVLWVDIALVSATGLTLDSLVQFIGQILPGADKVGVAEMPYYLQAKIVRLVDGLDLRLFEEALIARRAFLLRAGAE